MGRFRVCLRLDCPCTSLWRIITGAFLSSLLPTRSPDLRSQILGRRPIMLSAILLFALGSTICGAASSMNMLIAGRGSS
jgi:MFS family permease